MLFDYPSIFTLDRSRPDRAYVGNYLARYTDISAYRLFSRVAVRMAFAMLPIVWRVTCREADRKGFTLCLLILGDRTGFNPLLLNTGYLYQDVPVKHWLDQIPLARRPVSPRKALHRRCPANREDKI